MVGGREGGKEGREVRGRNCVNQESSQTHTGLPRLPSIL